MATELKNLEKELVWEKQAENVKPDPYAVANLTNRIVCLDSHKKNLDQFMKPPPHPTINEEKPQSKDWVTAIGINLKRNYFEFITDAVTQKYIRGVGARFVYSQKTQDNFFTRFQMLLEKMHGKVPGKILILAGSLDFARDLMFHMKAELGDPKGMQDRPYFSKALNCISVAGYCELGVPDRFFMLGKDQAISITVSEDGLFPVSVIEDGHAEIRKSPPDMKGDAAFTWTAKKKFLLAGALVSEEFAFYESAEGISFIPGGSSAISMISRNRI